MKGRVLIVDDEPDMLSTCKASLPNFSVEIEQKPLLALKLLREQAFDLLVTDIKMPVVSGLQLLKSAKEIDPELPVILMTAYPEVETAVGAIRNGAFDYVIKPFHPEDFETKVKNALQASCLKKENRLLARQVTRVSRSHEIIGESDAVKKMLELADKVSSTAANVLILGESGTGKELIARRIHGHSGVNGHFVPIDCGAIPENLLESEIFGHEKGAFTDAVTTNPGLLEFANHGTLFLDEICELPLSLQAKLLRALQERQFRRIGAREVINVELRILAASNRDIQKEVKEGRFREDLYYRLNVIAIHVPPLRERRDDIPLLVRNYLPRFSTEMNKNISNISEDGLEILSFYSWPGNIRELQNVLRKAIIACEKETLTAEDIPHFVVECQTMEEEREKNFSKLKKKQIASFEKEYFETLLKQHKGNAKSAADAAGLPLSNLYWYLKKHNIRIDSFH